MNEYKLTMTGNDAISVNNNSINKQLKIVTQNSIVGMLLEYNTVSCKNPSNCKRNKNLVIML